MKKIFLVMVILIGTKVFAQDFIGFDSGFELGYADTSFGLLILDTNYNGYDYLDFEASTMEKRGVWYATMSSFVWFWKTFYAGGAITVQMVTSGKSLTNGSIADFIPSFIPSFLNYNFETGLALGSFVLFLSHDCTHPQQTGSWNYRVSSIWGEGAITRVGVRFKADFGPVGKR